MTCPGNRVDFQQLGVDLALSVVMSYGKQFIYEKGDGTQVDIWALVMPGKETKNFGPDEDRITLVVPYQVGFTESPDSGSKIIDANSTTGTSDDTQYAIDTTIADDGAFPISWEVNCYRWMSPQPEIDGS
jgi:hypothetical protein